MSKNQSGPSSWDRTVTEQRDEDSFGFSFLPALTIMVLTRRLVGFRLLRPGRVMRVFLTLFLLGALSELAGATRFDVLLVWSYDYVFLVAAILHYWQGWSDIKQGVRRHSYSTGISRMEGRRLPRFLYQHRRIYRFLEPIVFGCFSVWMITASPPLGLWLLLSTLCLHSVEVSIYQVALQRHLDIEDGIIEGEILQMDVDHYSGKAQSRIAKGGNALPTGLAPDIVKHMPTGKKKGNGGSATH